MNMQSLQNTPLHLTLLVSSPDDMPQVDDLLSQIRARQVWDDLDVTVVPVRDAKPAQEETEAGSLRYSFIPGL